MAELTKYYGWGPRDAWSLTLKELVEWNKQAIRMAGNSDG
ncbi:GpE family phage tail protein [Pseudomonas veronii]|uniref:GpE family phage tail protein n=1 Tax=Pseudomonas veronii TaxID=76761 RepID=A0A5M8F806_PSEVE|nr:GpE family phage tail protein [Pseudomonas veronii]KAA6180857.1 GpE family phage tail protein [Pseudomonas veronii]NMY09036.1 GpE family phage tail protein [Pseudomonas veronii]